MKKDKIKDTKVVDAGITVYELNKNSYAQLPPLTKEQIDWSIDNILAPYIESGKKYFMLLCHEYHYYTLYELTHRNIMNQIGKKTAKDVVDLIQTDLGDLYDITTNDDGVIEIWVKNYDDKEMHAYFFFPYDKGVVEI